MTVPLAAGMHGYASTSFGLLFSFLIAGAALEL
jgi:hypothetical protein